MEAKMKALVQPAFSTLDSIGMKTQTSLGSVLPSKTPVR